ncbi:hypothetical protein X753_19850 [Mesorhizobium sp. LNJC399B00]|nr:hypothetical protein X753_19850 [Mesorhizobium sp. LNJC399B00]
MQDLNAAVRLRFKELDNSAPLKGNVKRWERFLSLANLSGEDIDLEQLLSRAKIASEILTSDDAKLAEELLQEAESAIRSKVDFLKDDTDLSVHEAFLRRVARRSPRRSRIKLFTTNYDLCFEMAARRSGFIVVDGFAFGSNAIFDPIQFSYDVVRRSSGDEKSDFIENLFHIHKLHGSIDWELSKKDGRISKVPGTTSPLLIYPVSTKYEMALSQPYIEMMGSLQASVRLNNTTLIVVGFGFNDKHIAEPILAAIRANLSLNLMIIDPSLAGTRSEALRRTNSYLATISELVEKGDGRITLVAAKFEEVIPFIPDIIAETELERHSERLRQIGQNG